MRRNLIFVWAMIALLITAVSCGEDKKDPTLKAEYTGVSVSATGGTATFTIESNVDWTVANSDAWITLGTTTGSNDGTVTVTFAANTTAQERSSTFTITSEAPTQQVTIAQAAATGTLTVEYLPEDIAAAGGTATFKVKTNVAWTATCPESWISMNPAQGTGDTDVTVTVAANTAFEARSATITVSGEGVNDAPVLITQLAAIDDSPLKFTDIKAGTYVANGTPSFLGEPGPSTWSGQLVPQNEDGITYYAITNFGGIASVFVDYIGNELFIDNFYSLGGNDNYDAYFDAAYVSNGKVYALSSYSPIYNKSTKTMDFAGKYEGKDVMVGISAHPKGSGPYNEQLSAGFSDMYINLKLVITPTSGSPEISNSSSVSFSGTAVNLENLKFGGVVKFDPAKFSKE